MILFAADSTLNALNAVGTLIWEAADGKTPVDAVVARICTEFDVEPAAARRDATVFIEKLRRRGLLSVSESPDQGP